jgi:hypothetical protein
MAYSLCELGSLGVSYQVVAVMSTSITVSIDLDNLYDEEYNECDESSPTAVSSLVKDAIKYEVQKQLRDLVSKSVTEQIQLQTESLIKDIAETTFKADMERRINNAFENLKVKDRYSDNMITVSEFVIKNVDSSADKAFDERVRTRVEKETKNAVSALVDQYNMQFASSLISKMKAAELLSEKGVLSLFNKNGGES